MADDTGQEGKEQDPVEAIRQSLQRALRSLKKLLGREDRELVSEIQEVEVGAEVAAGQVPSPTPQAPVDQGQQGTSQSPVEPAESEEQTSTTE